MAMEEQVLLHTVNLRDRTNQRRVNPEIKTIEGRLSPEVLWLHKSVQVSSILSNSTMEKELLKKFLMPMVQNSKAF